MAKPVKSIHNMTKHLTKAEIAARKEAEKSLTRSETNIKKPRNFTKDKVANYYWNKTIKDFEEVNLLDNLDADALATYCKVLSRMEQLEEALADADTSTERERIIMRLESAERTQLSYASKLGLTPESRVRLAKKKAQPKEADAEEDLYGGMQVIDCASSN